MALSKSLKEPLTYLARMKTRAPVLVKLLQAQFHFTYIRNTVGTAWCCSPEKTHITHIHTKVVKHFRSLLEEQY